MFMQSMQTVRAVWVAGDYFLWSFLSFEFGSVTSTLNIESNPTLLIDDQGIWYCIKNLYLFRFAQTLVEEKESFDVKSVITAYSFLPHALTM